VLISGNLLNEKDFSYFTSFENQFYKHMSDSSITIVPKQSNYPNAEEKAQELLSWLVSRNIVKNSISDCILSKNGGYAIAEGAQEITDETEYLPYDLLTNGLEIETGRQVFDNGENGIDEIICPSCHGDILENEWDISDWHEGRTDNLTCPLCNVQAEINTFNIEPKWGFSNLGFTFGTGRISLKHLLKSSSRS
jgi:hypothetical protein